MQKFVDAQIAFVEAERECEADEARNATSSYSKKELEKRGLAVTNLELCSTRTGFGGKTLVELERSSAVGGKINGLSTGDIVRIEDAKSGVDGVVVKVGERLTVAIDDDYDLGLVSVVKLANSITYDRMAATMRRLKPSRLADVLLGAKPSPVEDVDIELYDTTLNETQVAAVKHALGSPEVALIHGPPGTGKTYTLIEIIRQLKDKRVLVCGPSNISVDNIVERLATTGTPLVRVGHPARLLPVVVQHSLDVLTRSQIVRDIQIELDGNLQKMTKVKGKEKRELYLENKILRKEYREREKKSIVDVLAASKVVLCTLHGAGSRILQSHFDVVIIDEASQALEASCWIPLAHTTKVILAGDHMQLSPMLRSGHMESMFERLSKLHVGIKRLLSVQYRMNELICQFPSEALYDGKLIAGPGVGDRLLTDIIDDTDDTREPLIFIDTQGSMPESSDSESKNNIHEAGLVKKHVESLISAGLDPGEIAVVTPYSAQVAVLDTMLQDIEIGTVDGFQGREKEAVIVTLVRSNERKEVGFLADKRRLNVAMTRAKRQLVVIGDSETVSRDKFMKSWIDFLNDHAEVRYPEM